MLVIDWGVYLIYRRLLRGWQKKNIEHNKEYHGSRIIYFTNLI